MTESGAAPRPHPGGPPRGVASPSSAVPQPLGTSRRPSAPWTAPPSSARLPRREGRGRCAPRARLEEGPRAGAHCSLKGTRSHMYLHRHVNIHVPRVPNARTHTHAPAARHAHGSRPPSSHPHRHGFALACPPGWPLAPHPGPGSARTSPGAGGSAQRPSRARGRPTTARARTRGEERGPGAPPRCLLAEPSRRRLSPGRHLLPGPGRWPLGAARNWPRAPAQPPLPDPAGRGRWTPRPVPVPAAARPARPPAGYGHSVMRLAYLRTTLSSLKTKSERLTVKQFCLTGMGLYSAMVRARCAIDCL